MRGLFQAHLSSAQQAKPRTAACHIALLISLTV